MIVEKYFVPEQIPADIFRAYDIRGVVDEALSEDVVYAIGLALGSEAIKRGVKEIVCARDGRSITQTATKQT